MYMKRMVEIGKASNGYVIECRVPIKPKEKTNNKSMCDCYPGSSEKQYIAKDASEVVKILEKLMPMLDEDYKSEDEFDVAFGEAAEEKGKMKEDMPSKGKGAMKKEMY